MGPTSRSLDGTLRRLVQAHRQRLSRLTALAGLAIVALVLFPHVPRTVDVEFELGPAHQQIVELRVAYVRAGEELHGVMLSFPKGAPGTVHHSVSLPPGEFEVRAALRQAHGAMLASIGKLHAPAEGPVRIRLSQAVRSSATSMAEPAAR
jgi:hypothetical protein